MLRSGTEFSIKALRQSLEDDQVALIDKVLEYKKSKGKWMPALTLYLEMPKQEVFKITDNLCSSLLSERDIGQNKTEYQLGVLGYFVCSKGLEYEDLVFKYLKFARKLIRNDSHATKIASSELCSEYGISIDQSQELYEILQNCSFGGGSTSSGWGIWETGIPDAAEDIEENPAEYFQKRMKDFFWPEVPVTIRKQREVDAKKRPQSIPYVHGFGHLRTFSEYFYISEGRLNELRQLMSSKYDYCRLIRFCEELNAAYSGGNYLSCAFLLRAILDHVPPIFGASKFSEIDSTYRGSKSFREAMTHLNTFSRKIADNYIHGQIRKNETLPTDQQVNFAPALDLLLGEVVRVARAEAGDAHE